MGAVSNVRIATTNFLYHNFMCRIYLFNLEELIAFKAIRSKDDCEYPITFPIDGTIAQLKEHIHSLIGIIIFILHTNIQHNTLTIIIGIPEKNIKLAYSEGEIQIQYMYY